MYHNNSQIGFYADALIVEAFLKNDLSKMAGEEISSLTQTVIDYFESHKSGSILNMLAPGILFAGLKAMNLGGIGFLIATAMSVFNIDVESILKSIYDKIKGPISEKKQFTSPQVDGIISASVEEHTSEPEKEASFHKQLRDATFIRLAIENKNADLFGRSKKTMVSNLLVRVLSFVFKILLYSAGFMVLGDVINKILGRPNHLDGSYQKDKTTSDAPSAQIITSTQTKFKLNPSYQDNKQSLWVEAIPNNSSSIENMLVDFAKEVYTGLNGLDDIIKGTPGFQVAKSRIVFYNQNSQGDNMVFIPKYFASKKAIVDLFIDDVAKRSPDNVKSPEQPLKSSNINV